MNLEKRAYKRKHIVKLKTNENQYLGEPNKILIEMENFYKTLYSYKTWDDSFDASASPFANCNNMKRLDGEQQKTCEGLISEEECLSALKKFAKNKTSPRNFTYAFGNFLQSFKGMPNRCLSWGNVDLAKKGRDFPAAKKEQRHSSPKKLATNYLVEHWL